MNKLTKGAIATGVGVVLLMGGAGTLATWNSSTTIPSAQIQAGNLLVADSGTAGTWTANGSSIDITTFKAVPGDSLVYTKTIAITATGNNLVATLGLGSGSIEAVSSSNANDVALAGYLTKNASLTATGTGIATSGGVTTVTAGPAGVSQNVTVQVTINFPKSGTAGLVAEANTKLGKVNLKDLTVTLTQN